MRMRPPALWTVVVSRWPTLGDHLPRERRALCARQFRELRHLFLLPSISDFPVTRALPPRSYVGSDLIGNLDRRVSGVSAAGVDVDDDIVFERQRASTAPAGGTGIQFSRGGTQCAVRVGDLADGPLRSAARVGVLAAGRPPLDGGIEEGAGFSTRGNSTTACLR